MLGRQAPRRIRQNTRHFIEIMLPGALHRTGDGWKLSVRIRLVHAQVRRLVRQSGHWDESRYGVPLSPAHMALASANFSATMLRQAERLGAAGNPEERRAFMQIRRYASLLIGTPEDLLFDGDEAQTHELYRIARTCEPPPSPESIAIAHALVNALLDIAGITAPRQRAAFIQHTYRVSRALLGRQLADQLQFPPYPAAGLLTYLKWRRRIYMASRRLVPKLAEKWRGDNFAFLLEASRLLDLSYRLPDRLAAQQTSPW